MATHAPPFGTVDLPRPARAALPLLALSLIALTLEADPRLQLAGLAAAGCFALAGTARATHAHKELRAVRRTADRLILADGEGAEGSNVVRWRIGELVAPASRQRLAREIEQALRRLDPVRLPSASPLRRGLARQHQDLLQRLEERMLDGRPVTARGVLLLRRLLREPGSPLYDAVNERELSRALATLLVALQP